MFIPLHCPPHFPCLFGQRKRALWCVPSARRLCLFQTQKHRARIFIFVAASWQQERATGSRPLLLLEALAFTDLRAINPSPPVRGEISSVLQHLLDQEAKMPTRCIAKARSFSVFPRRQHWNTQPHFPSTPCPMFFPCKNCCSTFTMCPMMRDPQRRMPEAGKRGKAGGEETWAAAWLSRSRLWEECSTLTMR